MKLCPKCLTNFWRTPPEGNIVPHVTGVAVAAINIARVVRALEKVQCQKCNGTGKIRE